MKGFFKYSFIIGCLLNLIAIIIGIIWQHDIAFIFSGIGIIFIGISILVYINKEDDK